jgi:hypothetical protein
MNSTCSNCCLINQKVDQICSHCEGFSKRNGNTFPIFQGESFPGVKNCGHFSEWALEIDQRKDQEIVKKCNCSSSESNSTFEKDAFSPQINFSYSNNEFYPFLGKLLSQKEEAFRVERRKIQFLLEDNSLNFWGTTHQSWSEAKAHSDEP